MRSFGKFGFVFGLIIGLMIGVFTGRIAIWIAVGVALGVAFSRGQQRRELKTTEVAILPPVNPRVRTR